MPVVTREIKISKILTGRSDSRSASRRPARRPRRGGPASNSIFLLTWGAWVDPSTAGSIATHGPCRRPQDASFRASCAGHLLRVHRPGLPHTPLVVATRCTPRTPECEAHLSVDVHSIAPGLDRHATGGPDGRGRACGLCRAIHQGKHRAPFWRDPGSPGATIEKEPSTRERWRRRRNRLGYSARHKTTRVAAWHLAANRILPHCRALGPGSPATLGWPFDLERAAGWSATVKGSPRPPERQSPGHDSGSPAIIRHTSSLHQFGLVLVRSIGRGPDRPIAGLVGRKMLPFERPAWDTCCGCIAETYLPATRRGNFRGGAPLT